jgi:hypothetical protein
MRTFARQIKHAFDVTIERPHDAVRANMVGP